MLDDLLLANKENGKTIQTDRTPNELHFRLCLWQQKHNLVATKDKSAAKARHNTLGFDMESVDNP